MKIIYRINNNIKVDKVRLIDNNGNQIGIINIEDALKKSKKMKLDLIEINPNTFPPVCKIMDYGKFIYEINKLNKKQKKKQKITQIKEIKFRPVINDNDYYVKIKKIIMFLKNNIKVKVTLRFRGREILYKNIGINLLNKIRKDLFEYNFISKSDRIENKQISIFILPKSIKK